MSDIAQAWVRSHLPVPEKAQLAHSLQVPEKGGLGTDDFRARLVGTSASSSFLPAPETMKKQREDTLQGCHTTAFPSILTQAAILKKSHF